MTYPSGNRAERRAERSRARRQRRRTLKHFRDLGVQLVAEGRSMTARERSDLDRAKVRLGFVKRTKPIDQSSPANAT